MPIHPSMRIAFRTDSSLQIGTGHMMRCLTLADELSRRGHDVLFVCRELVGNINGLVRDRGHRLETLPIPAPSEVQAGDDRDLAHAAWLGVSWDTDAEQTGAVLDHVCSGRVDWLIVDHYALGTRWETQLRRRCIRLMVIDDLADRPHNCDLLLDQNLYPNMEKRYCGLIPDSCQIRLGPRFALLRPEFAEARRKLPNRIAEVRRVLVFFGGVDAENATMRALDALALVAEPSISVDIVIGQTNPHREQVLRYCEGHPQLCVHVQTERIAELMAAADLAIGSGGVATWERCALALPALVWPVAENQRQVIAAVAGYGAVYAPDPESILDPENLSRHIFALVHSRPLCQHLGARAASLCDGHGARRTADLIAPIEVRLRPAMHKDCDRVHRWRNQPGTRQASIDSAAIPYADHRAWFERTLADPTRALLIAEQHDGPVGVLRYDFDSEGATVSLYRVPGMSGAGIGKAMLLAGEAWLVGNHPEVKCVRAQVLEANAPSKAAFEGCDFLPHHIVYEKALTR